MFSLMMVLYPGLSLTLQQVLALISVWVRLSKNILVTYKLLCYFQFIVYYYKHMLQVKNSKNQLSYHQQTQGNNDELHKIIREFITNTFHMIRNNFHQEQVIIEQIYHHLGVKQQKAKPLTNMKKQNLESIKLQKIQKALLDLTKESDLLSERLFDLNQMMIQNKIIQIEKYKIEMSNKFQREIMNMKQKYEEQIFYLKNQVREHTIKYQNLQNYVKESKKYQIQYKNQQEYAVIEVHKYLMIIEQLKEQIQQLKIINSRQNVQEPSSYNQYVHHQPPACNSYNINDSQEMYSQKYYNGDYDAKTTLGSVAIRRTSDVPYQNYQRQPAFSQYKQEYYHCPNRVQAVDCQRRQRSNNNKIVQSQIMNSIRKKNNLIFIQKEPENRERSKSTERQKRQYRSTYKTNGEQYNNNLRFVYVEKPTNKNDQYIDKYHKKNDYREMQEKNERLRDVEDKLRRVKSNLQSELRRIKK